MISGIHEDFNNNSFFYIANVDIDFDVYTFPTRHAMSECSLIVISISYVLE